MVGNLPAYTHAARDPGRFFFAYPANGQLPVSNIQFQPFYCASQQEKSLALE
jgi:hypothetical protein